MQLDGQIIKVGASAHAVARCARLEGMVHFHLWFIFTYGSFSLMVHFHLWFVFTYGSSSLVLYVQLWLTVWCVQDHAPALLELACIWPQCLCCLSWCLLQRNVRVAVLRHPGTASLPPLLAAPWTIA